MTEPAAPVIEAEAKAKAEAPLSTAIAANEINVKATNTVPEEPAVTYESLPALTVAAPTVTLSLTPDQVQQIASAITTSTQGASSVGTGNVCAPVVHVTTVAATQPSVTQASAAAENIVDPKLSIGLPAQIAMGAAVKATPQQAIVNDTLKTVAATSTTGASLG